VAQEYRATGGRGMKTRPTVLSKARDAWDLFSRKHTGLNVPVWYPGLYGVPAWHLRQPCSGQTEQRKGISLLARMNYILDFPDKFVGKAECAWLARYTAGRPLRAFLTTVGKIYSDGEYHPLVNGGLARGPCMAYAASRSYDWKCALTCTLRSFVHLLALITGTSRPYIASCSLPVVRSRPKSGKAK